MSAQKPKKNKDLWDFDDDSIESLKAYYKIGDSQVKDLYNFVRQTHTTRDGE